mmetsp:Transcript_30629/g.61507  ORF Transcript_30629/g.61507 Transcript_30629/m.61507 type:complete len:165 (-) Transcript_30629:101-595(-)
MAGQYAAAAKGSPPPPSPSPSPSPTPGPAPSGDDTLIPGDTLAPGADLKSAGAKARLEMQASDGNLVLYGPGGKALWSSGTGGHPQAHVSFQKSDGNLVVYNGLTALWSSGPNVQAAKAQLQDDCNFVISDAKGVKLWSMGTNCGATGPSLGPSLSSSPASSHS